MRDIVAVEEIEVIELANGYKIIFKGVPETWSAPTYGKRGVYDKKWRQKRDAILLLSEWALRTLSGPLTLKVFFYMPIPKSVGKKTKNRLLASKTPHLKHRDLGNLEKLITDIVQNAHVIVDDCLIYHMELTKYYATEPRIEYTIRESNVFHEQQHQTHDNNDG